MKLGAKHNSKSRGVGIKFLCKVATIFVALFLGVSLTYAYFTARAEEKQEIYFANISVDFVNSNDVYTTTLFDGQTLGGVQPGQKINLNSVYVKNIGEYAVYAIYRLKLNITKVGATEAETFVYWYNLDGTVLSGDETSTTDKATLLSAAAKKQTNLVLSISGELDNSYKKATANIDLQVLAIQGLIKEETNLDKAIQACQLLIKNQDQADIEHTLYIRPNGGTYNNSNTTQTINQNRDTTLSIGTPTREGYTFKGWAFSGDGKFASSTYTFGKSVGTLTAQWQAISSKVSFDYNNGENQNILKFNDYIKEPRNSTTIIKFPVDNLVIGKTYTLSSAKPMYWIKISNAPDGYNSIQHEPSIAVTSYTFTMARNSNIPSSATQYLYIGLKKGATSLPADISAYDGYNLKLEEGSTATAYTEPARAVDYESYYGTLPTPKRQGYTFNGWYGVNQFNKNNYLLTSNYTQASPYTYAPINLKPNTTYVVSVYRKNGYQGKDGYLLLSKSSAINDNWTAITHTSNPNTSTTGNIYTTGADGLLYIGYSSINQGNLNTIWANTDVVIREQTGGLTGGYFNSTTAEFADGYEPFVSTQAVTSSTVVNVTENHTLVASWTANKYSVNFNANGGSVSTTSKTVTFDTMYGELPTPIRDGYTFNGWKRQLYYSTAELKATGTFMACVDLAPYIDKYGFVEYTVEFDLKSADTTNGNIILGYMQNGAGTKYSGFYQDCNVTTEYKHFSYDFTATKGDKYDTQSQAMLAFYGYGKQGNLARVKNIKVMLKKPYTTASSVYQDATNVVLVADWTTKTASTSVQAQNQTHAQTKVDFVLPSKQNIMSKKDTLDVFNISV